MKGLGMIPAGGQWGTRWVINHHYADLDSESILNEGGRGCHGRGLL